MCIVSLYFYNDSDFVLTQNRDEDENRKSSNKIENLEWYGQKVQAPVDLQSGGTWIYNTHQFTVCILNGEYKKHKHQPPYRASRGKVIIELLQFSTIKDFYEQVNLNKIEPFTMIMIDKTKKERYILVWNGVDKHLEYINNHQLVVRSSSPLYTQSEKDYNYKEIEGLINKTPEFLYKKHFDLRMLKFNYSSNIRTTSIVQVIHQNSKTSIDFHAIKKQL